MPKIKYFHGESLDITPGISKAFPQRDIMYAHRYMQLHAEWLPEVSFNKFALTMKGFSGDAELPLWCLPVKYSGIDHWKFTLWVMPFVVDSLSKAAKRYG